MAGKILAASLKPMVAKVTIVGILPTNVLYDSFRHGTATKLLSPMIKGIPVPVLFLFFWMVYFSRWYINFLTNTNFLETRNVYVNRN